MREVAAGKVEAQPVAALEQIGAREHRHRGRVRPPRFEQGRRFPRIAIANRSTPSVRFIANPSG
jgi:hypothetical protein